MKINLSKTNFPLQIVIILIVLLVYIFYFMVIGFLFLYLVFNLFESVVILAFGDNQRYIAFLAYIVVFWLLQLTRLHYPHKSNIINFFSLCWLLVIVHRLTILFDSSNIFSWLSALVLLLIFMLFLYSLYKFYFIKMENVSSTVDLELNSDLSWKYRFLIFKLFWDVVDEVEGVMWYDSMHLRSKFSNFMQQNLPYRLIILFLFGLISISWVLFKESSVWLYVLLTFVLVL